MSDTKFAIGSEWRTRGGWKATVVWKYRNGNFQVIHELGGNEIAFGHTESGYLLHVANETEFDLLTPWTESPRLPDGVPWPKWAKAAARDENGEWFWFGSVPKSGFSIWNTAGFDARMHPTEYPDFKGDWRDSLIVRKEGE